MKGRFALVEYESSTESAPSSMQATVDDGDSRKPRDTAAALGRACVQPPRAVLPGLESTSSKGLRSPARANPVPTEAKARQSDDEGQGLTMTTRRSAKNAQRTSLAGTPPMPITADSQAQGTHAGVYFCHCRIRRVSACICVVIPEPAVGLKPAPVDAAAGIQQPASPPAAARPSAEATNREGAESDSDSEVRLDHSNGALAAQAVPTAGGGAAAVRSAARARPIPAHVGPSAQAPACSIEDIARMLEHGIDGPELSGPMLIAAAAPNPSVPSEGAAETAAKAVAPHDAAHIAGTELLPSEASGTGPQQDSKQNSMADPTGMNCNSISSV